MPGALRNDPFESAIKQKKSLKESSEINQFCNNFDQDSCNQLIQQYDNSSIRKVVSSMKINKQNTKVLWLLSELVLRSKKVSENMI